MELRVPKPISKTCNRQELYFAKLINWPMKTKEGRSVQRGENAARGAPTTASYLFREPTAADGRAVWQLIADCRPLDPNSLYCNLLQCTHFAETCILAEQGGQIRGWISAYRPPTDPQTLFIWQVAIHCEARGRGLASALIKELLERDAVRDIRQLAATVTPDNTASWALFRSLADSLDAPLTSEEHFEREQHFGGRHQSEYMLTIGPWYAAAEPGAHRSA
jgi:L-2,4-diaminobutyric acid acetyltransferase